jgi:NadR type nicotinamide-nucleotide adenylyltransferase
MLKKIAIIGPESTGKSTLCQQLAEHYHTLWCPEFAREYLLEYGMDYSYDDLLTIAKGQVALEEKFVQLAKAALTADGSRLTTQGSRLLFIDTDMYVMKVWCEFVFGKCHQYILDEIAERKYDLYFLCNVDLPWVHDELREYPDIETRQKLYQIYKDIMTKQTVPWVEISGDSHTRLQRAIVSVDQLVSP